ncbi:MAG: SpoIIE family protein phosphatase [Chloroflexi bacterium]|nr:SpoIIE family protein phosphatase [Chloroflexota bacterium]
MSNPAGEPSPYALIYRVSQILSLTPDPDAVLERVMDEVIAATRAERGFLILRDDTGRATFHAARGLDHRTIESPEFQVSRTILNGVLDTGAPRLTADAQGDGATAASDSASKLHLRSVLCAPLQSGGRTVGAIYVDNRLKSGAFGPQDLDLLGALAHQAAIALDNARMFRDVNTRLQSLRLIHDINADLTSTLNLNRVLIASLERIQQVLGTEAGSILMLEGDELVFKVAVGEASDRLNPFRIPKGHGLAGWVVENARGVVINDVQHDPRFYSNVDAGTGFITRELMAAPLIMNGRVTGVVEVFNKPGGFSDADLDLLSTIGSSAAIAIENARLYEVAVEKGRLERELQVAHEVQANLIPRETPRVPGWSFAAQWQSALEMSGDYYDFVSDDPARVGVVLGDVADKGMAAALFMALTRSTMRASAAGSASPALALARTNRLVAADSANGMFVTLCYAQIEPASGALRIANAGHPAPILYRAASGDVVELTRHGIALGVIDDAEYVEESATMQSGDILLIYTDGVTDALNARGEDFGHDRLLETVRDFCRRTPADLHAKLSSTLKQFVGATPPADDMTFVIVRRD